jgi:hypothetical protein
MKKGISTFVDGPKMFEESSLLELAQLSVEDADAAVNRLMRDGSVKALELAEYILTNFIDGKKGD